MLLVFKILGLVIAAVGAVVALFGNSHEHGKLTKLGRLAGLLVLCGLLCSVTIEVFQWRAKSADIRKQDLEARKTLEWELVSMAPIEFVHLRFFQRREMPVKDFLQYISRIHVSMSIPSSSPNGSSSSRSLAFRANKTPPREPILLYVTTGKGKRGFTVPVDLYKKELPIVHHEPAPRSAESTLSVAPNAESRDSRLRTSTGTIVSLTAMINGWPYTVSARHVWTNPRALTCGIDSRIPWNQLAGSAAVSTLKDFASAGGSLSVTLDEGIDLSIVDSFELSFFAGDHVIPVDLMHRKYALSDDGKWEFFTRGFEMYSLLQSSLEVHLQD